MTQRPSPSQNDTQHHKKSLKSSHVTAGGCHWLCVSVAFPPFPWILGPTHTHAHTLSYRHTVALIPAVLSVNINGWSHVDWYDSVAEPRTLQLRSADESVSTGLMTSSGAATLHCLAGHISLEAGWRGEKTEPILNFMWHKSQEGGKSAFSNWISLQSLLKWIFHRQKQRFTSVYLSEMTGASEIVHISVLLHWELLVFATRLLLCTYWFY